MRKFKLFNIRLSNQKGFTLIELLIYMGLLSFLLIIFTDIFASILDNQLQSKNTSNVSDDGRYIYSKFIYDVTRADEVVIPEAFGSPSAILRLLIDGQPYTYFLNENSLFITTPDGTNALNGNGSYISSLLFTKIGTPSAKSTVRINFTINGIATGRNSSESSNFQTTAGLR